MRDGRWWYYSRSIEGEQYSVHARIAVADSHQRPVLDPMSVPEGEQVLLDGNKEAAGQEFFALGAFDVSPDHQLLAYAVDNTGDERFNLLIKDLESDAIVDDVVVGIGAGVAWSLAGDYVFYTRVDDAWRPHQVWRHKIGTAATEDVLVFSEGDERFWMGLGSSRDNRYLLIALGSKNSTEFRLLDASDPTGEFQVVQERAEGVEYDIELAGDHAWILHNWSCPDFELAVAALDGSVSHDWETVVAGQEGVRLTAVDAFKDFLALSMRRDGLAHVQIIPRDEHGRAQISQAWDVSVSEELFTVDVGINPDYTASTLMVLVESMITPRSVFDLDVASAQMTLVKQHAVLGGYDPADYQQHRVWATAADGTQIPISLVARADVAMDGTAPGMLYGYGSYEISIDPWFSVSRLSYLDRGVVYAVAHVRGGGEMGRHWYEQGRMLNKKNSFTDFVACADHLIEMGWVAPDRLAAEGRSAGGLLMGAIVNLAPDRFRVVHAGVAFVDALNTILDPSLPLTVVEWEEWGDPLHNADVYEYMREYTPYENLAAVEYPAILATTGLNDTRVYYTEPAKWVAKMRQTVANGADRPILLRTEMVAGHGGKTGRYDAWREAAFEISFVLDQLGADQIKP
nr:S9 family peptidase [Ornithinimicrobium sp. INDO-MA30-4]